MPRGIPSSNIHANLASAHVEKREPIYKVRRGYPVAIHKANLEVDAQIGVGHSTLVLHLNGDTKLLADLIANMDKFERFLMKHIEHMDHVQCPVCIADAMSDERTSETGYAEQSTEGSSAVAISVAPPPSTP